MSISPVRIEGLQSAITLVDGISERRMRYALATALTRTALLVRDAQQNVINTRLDRPNPYTRRALWVQTATGSQDSAGNRALPINGDAYNTRLVSSRYLQAAVGIKDDSGGSGTPAVKYLAPLIEGTTRNVKRFELALQATGAMPRGWYSVPAAGARLDAYGNISRGQIGQILSQLGTELTAGYTRTISRDPRKRIAAQRRAGGQFFAVLPGQRSRLKPGVYVRELIGRNITPVLLYVRRVAYRPIWDFHGLAADIAQSELPRQLDRAIADHLDKLQRAGGTK